MGKSKGKSSRTSVQSDHNVAFDHYMLPTEEESPLKAADGINVDGWTGSDIRTYNELLKERAKLEKEKDELERKSSRHQTHRALLDESSTALDNSFKLQLSGEYKFTGPARCCLDLDDIHQNTPQANRHHCKHGICRRAKTKGVSWMEMDTIKYYHARIATEKSSRMQAALRKQRDVELDRVRKDDEEELALRNRKQTYGLGEFRASMGDSYHNGISNALENFVSKDILLDPRNAVMFEAAKENEQIVGKIREELEKIRRDVNTGKVSPADARVKLNQANFDMAEAERKNNDFRQTILNSDPTISRASQSTTTNMANILSQALAGCSSDAFSHALSVMKGFFSASAPQDIQTAITDLRKVLQMTGPMSPVLSKSFQALEEMLSRRDSGDHAFDEFTGDDKKRTPTSVIEALLNLREEMHITGATSTSLDLSKGLDKVTVEANQECIRIENAAMKDMALMAQKMADQDHDQVAAALCKIKDEALLKCPIPPLSDMVLDDKITTIIFSRSVEKLVSEAYKGAGQSELQAKITSLVLKFSDRKPERFMEVLDMVRGSVTVMREPSRTLLEALLTVETSMTKFVAKAQGGGAKQRANGSDASTPNRQDHITETGHASAINMLAHKTDALLRSPPTTSSALKRFQERVQDTRIIDHAQLLRSTFVRYYEDHLEEGIWEVFKVFSIHKGVHLGVRFEPGHWLDQTDFYRENMAFCQTTAETFLDSIFNFARSGVCPSQAIVVLSQQLTYQARVNFDMAISNIRSLANTTGQKVPRELSDWFLSWAFVASAVTDLYMLLVCEVTEYRTKIGLRQHTVPVVAADIISLICAFVIAVPDGKQALDNLKMIEAFMGACFLDYNQMQDSEAFATVWDCFTYMTKEKRHRCGTDHACRAKVKAMHNATKSPKKGALEYVPGAIKDEKGILPTKQHEKIEISSSESNNDSSQIVQPTNEGCSDNVALSDELNDQDGGKMKGQDRENANKKHSRFSELLDTTSISQPAFPDPPENETHHMHNTERTASDRQMSATVKNLYSTSQPQNVVQPSFSACEVEIQRKLSKLVAGLLKLKDSITDSRNPGHAFAPGLHGVADQLKQTARIHYEVAFTIARAQGYTALQEWLEKSSPWRLGCDYDELPVSVEQRTKLQHTEAQPESESLGSKKKKVRKRHRHSTANTG